MICIYHSHLCWNSLLSRARKVLQAHITKRQISTPIHPMCNTSEDNSTNRGEGTRPGSGCNKDP